MINNLLFTLLKYQLKIKDQTKFIKNIKKNKIYFNNLKIKIIVLKIKKLTLKLKLVFNVYRIYISTILVTLYFSFQKKETIN